METPVMTIMCATPRGDQPAPKGKDTSLTDLADRIVAKRNGAPKDALGGDGTEAIPPGLRRTKGDAQDAAKPTKTDRLPVPPPKGQDAPKAPPKAKAPAKIKTPAAPKPTPKAKDKPAAQAKPAVFGKVVRAGSKAELVGNLLLREEGCTKDDVLNATGWPSVSMPAQARAVGLNLVKEKDKGKPTRYWGELPA